MATLLPEGKQSFETSAGIPLVGGKVYTYDAGTNNPRVTYQDAAATTPNTNPVILDARGEATIFWSGAYKVVLKDALDNTIWTVDNVQSTDVLALDLATTNSATKGAGQIGYNRALAYAEGTVGAKLQQLVSVFDFMTAAQIADVKARTLVQDVTAAIQTALNTARFVYLPAGAYKITSPLYMTGEEGTPGGQRLVGAGPGASEIVKTTTTAGVGSNTHRGGTVVDTYVVDAAIIVTHADNGYAYNVEISNLSITSNSSNNAYAIYHPRATHMLMEEVRTYAFQFGNFTYDTWLSTFRRVIHWGYGRVNWKGFAWTIDTSGGPSGTTCTFIDCWARDGSGIGWYLQGLGYSSLVCCAADNIVGTAYQLQTSQITMSGCGMENIDMVAAGYGLYLANGYYVLSGCRCFDMVGANLATYLFFDSCFVTLDGCKFDNFTTANGAYNLGIQNGVTMVDSNNLFPTNGNTFVSYSANSVRFQPATDSVISGSGQGYALRSQTPNLRRENYNKAIAAGATNIFTISFTGNPASAFVRLRTHLNDAGFPNGAIVQEVSFAFHYDGVNRQNSAVINTVRAGNNLTGDPTYAIAYAAGTWTVSITPIDGACTATMFAEVVGVGAPAVTFAWS